MKQEIQLILFVKKNISYISSKFIEMDMVWFVKWFGVSFCVHFLPLLERMEMVQPHLIPFTNRTYTFI